MARFTLKEMLVQAQAAVSGTPVGRSGHGRRRAVIQCVHANGARYTVGGVRGDSVFSTYGPFCLLQEAGPVVVLQNVPARGQPNRAEPLAAPSRTRSSSQRRPQDRQGRGRDEAAARRVATWTSSLAPVPSDLGRHWVAADHVSAPRRLSASRRAVASCCSQDEQARCRAVGPGARWSPGQEGPQEPRRRRRRAPPGRSPRPGGGEARGLHRQDRGPGPAARARGPGAYRRAAHGQTR